MCHDDPWVSVLVSTLHMQPVMYFAVSDLTDQSG
jgi:hypothetical protein